MVQSKKRTFLIESCNLIFASFEIIAFSTFYKENFNSKKINKVINFIILVFFIAFIFFIVQGVAISSSRENLRTTSSIINSVELLLIGILSLMYFFKLFQKYTPLKLTHRPSFWIASGAIFYSFFLPSTLLIIDPIRFENLNAYFSIITLHYVSLGILFLAISKAYSCKKPLTT
jgi:hypothetical protein